MDVLPYMGKSIYPSLYLMIQKPVEYAIINGTLSRYEYYKCRSDKVERGHRNAANGHHALEGPLRALVPANRNA